MIHRIIASETTTFCQVKNCSTSITIYIYICSIVIFHICMSLLESTLLSFGKLQLKLDLQRFSSVAEKERTQYICVHIWLKLHILPHVVTLCYTYTDDDDDLQTIRMEVASSRPDHLPTLSAGSPTDTVGRITYRHCRPDHLPILTEAKTSKLSLLVKHHILAIDEAS